MIKKNRNWLFYLSGTTLFLAFFFTLNVFAQTENNPVNSQKETLDLNQLANSFPPKTAFSQIKDEDIKRTFSFYTQPFVDFKLNVNPVSKTNFSPGETLILKGDLAYSYDNVNKVVSNITDKCFKIFQNKSQEEKIGICDNPEIFKIPSFQKVGIFVQIWRDDQDKESAKSKGDYLIEEFYLKEISILEENKQVPFELKWNLPKELISGNYHLSFYLNEQKNFSLSGFPVDSFSPLARTNFNVLNTENKKNEFVLSKDKITINDVSYSQTSPMQLIEARDGKIDIKTEVTNLSGNENNLKIKYQLYKWTQEDPTNIVDEKEMNEKLSQSQSLPLNYSFVPNNLYGFYTLKISANSSTTSSLANIHFIVKTKDSGRFMYLGLVKDKTGKISPMFCPRNTQWTGFFKGKIKLVVTEENKQIGTWEKEGFIEPVDGMCFIAKIDSLKNSYGDKCTEIKGEIFDDQGQMTDRVVSKYNCETEKTSIEKTIQEGKKTSVSNGFLFNSIFGLNLTLIFFLIVIAFLSLVLYIYFKKRDQDIH